MLTMSLLLTPMMVVAQPSERGWTADARTGCRVVNPHPQPDETVTWSGACKNGFAEGQGLLQWFQSKRPFERYEGEMLGGQMDGHGTLITGNGGRYVGGFHNGKADGFGEWTSARGNASGLWTNGCFNSGGVRAWVGGDSSACP
jgi:hypothetical protein